jgi:dTDP-N-acetylfucosamine:lipid II N-acetylfucosaminyltransferase
LRKPNMILHYKSFGLFNYIASPFEKDYLNACKYLKINPERLYFSFLSIEELFSEEILTTVPNPGKRIMVGHSGALENNHLDVFDTLGSIVKNQEIYCPLAYGSDSYIQKVKQAGYSTFPGKFIPQIEFLPKKEYYSRLTQIGIAIFNHKIQQAFGNIIALVFLGAKVYLNPENPIYFQLEKWGVKVYDYGKITSDELETPISNDDINSNRKIIHKLFNEEQINSLYINLLSV